MSSKLVCVDASLVVRLVTSADDAAAWTLWERWHGEKRQVIAPSLLNYEVINALFMYYRVQQMSLDAVKKSFEAALALPVRLYQSEELHRTALDLADRFSLKATYDAHYLALAKQMNTDLWTVDRRLVKAVQDVLPWVHFLEQA